MRTFYNFIEAIIDPKRNPKKTPGERLGQMGPDDDDYDPRAHDELDDMYDDEPGPTGGNGLGLNAQYPLAQSSGKMRGFQVKTPKEMFRKPDVVDDKLSGRELFDTLRAKLRSGERMTSREITILLKLLNKQDEKLRSPKRSTGMPGAQV